MCVCETSVYVWGFTFRFGIPRKASFRIQMNVAGGTWSMDRSGANEDTYPMLVISRLITVTYLLYFFRNSTGLSLEPQLQDLFLHGCHNLYFAETMSPMTSLLIFTHHVADGIWIILSEILSPMHILMPNLDTEITQGNIYFS